MPAAIETGAQVVRRQRPEAAVVDVVLARPHHLDRPLDLLRQHHGVDDEVDVAIAAAAEAAAHQQIVQLDLVARDAEQLGRRLRARWSGSACRPRSRRHRPPATPTRPRSAAPSARDRRSRSGTRPRSRWRLSGTRRAHRLARSSRGPPPSGSRASAAKASMPLVAVEAPGHAGPAPGDANRSAPGAPRRRPTGVSATTPTPCGSLITPMTPGTALALASSILSGTEPSTGARSTVPYSIPGTCTSMP